MFPTLTTLTFWPVRGEVYSSNAPNVLIPIPPIPVPPAVPEPATGVAIFGVGVAFRATDDAI